MAANDTQLAWIENGKIYLFSEPQTAAELSSDAAYVGHPRSPLVPPEGAKCGVVTELGPEGHAGFDAITDPVQILVVESLFELKRKIG
jgi:hypothetical protein